MIDSKTELHQSCTIKQFAGFYKMFAVFLKSKHCLLLRLKEANMSTTATPSETPSSGSTSARARLMPVGNGTGNAWLCHLTICHHFVTRPSKQSGTSFGAPWVLIIFCGGFFLKKMIFFWISGWHRTTWQGTLPNRTTPSEGPSDCSTWLLHDKLSQKNHDTGMFSW